MWKTGFCSAFLPIPQEFHRSRQVFHMRFNSLLKIHVQKKVPAVSAAFNSYRSGLVESVVESCGMCFPQLVEAVFRVQQVFHDFFHKLLFSTPQTFHFSRVKKAFHFSGNFPQAVCGKDLPEIPRRICGFHFSGASIITTIYSFLCILSFRSFAAKNSG